MLKKLLLTTALATALSGCGERVEVPPAYVGKILTAEGYREDVVPPSKFRLPMCLAYCDKLVVLETADRGIVESMKLFMPKDQLNMSFDIRATISISNDTKTVHDIFDRVVASKNNKIGLSEVYNTYAQQKFRSVSRSVLSEYTINEVASNRAAVEQKLYDELVKALKPTPVKLLQLGLADVQFPEVIVKAKEIAKEREVEIEKAEAEKEIRLARADADLQVAIKEKEVRLQKAQTIREENLLVAKSVTGNYLKYRQLEVMEQVAKSGSAIYVPLGTDLVLVGDNKNVIPVKK